MVLLMSLSLAETISTIILEVLNGESLYLERIIRFLHRSSGMLNKHTDVKLCFLDCLLASV